MLVISSSILAAIFVTIAIKVKLMSYFYTWTILLINKKRLAQKKFLVFSLISGGGGGGGWGPK